VNDVVAAIDVGTNSIHLVVARVTGGNAVDVLAREKEMVRLGSGGGDMKHLAEDAVDRAISVLTRFRQVAEVHRADTLSAVATSAVREAENRHSFVSRAESEAGVKVDVISGFEEARLIYLGVLQALPVYDERVVLCDVGGGSTELLLGQRGETVSSRSFKLGAIRLTERFFGGERLHPGAVDTCRRYIRATIASFTSSLRAAGFDRAVGSSGTVGALCAMAAAADGPAPQTLNGYTLTRSQLGDALLALVRAPTPADRAKLAGLDARRADIILAGALILEQVFDALELDFVTFSDSALREGVLLDALRRRHRGALNQQ
jgi:exopolyphosphatase/guanosine-5'-triphosphate,3'-diphosphate pyrophosphatase